MKLQAYLNKPSSQADSMFGHLMQIAEIDFSNASFINYKILDIIESYAFENVWVLLTRHEIKEIIEYIPTAERHEEEFQFLSKCLLNNFDTFFKITKG